MSRTVTHSELFHFFARLLPHEELLYHSPLPPSRPYNPSHSTFVAHQVILSLTPTEGVYRALEQASAVRKRTVVFLHRPFRLDRRRVPHGTLVLASHVRYDELYTTGYNEAFMDSHGVPHDPASRVAIQGYKDDPARRIGLFGRLAQSRGVAELVQAVSEAFEGHDLVQLAPSPSSSSSNDDDDSSEDTLADGEIAVLASLNAFTPEIITRITEAAAQLHTAPSQVLCVTGAVRELGLHAAKQSGLNVVAVGHKRCEVWGMKHFERLLGSAFGDIEVVRVDEPEEEVQRQPKQKQQQKQRTEGGKPQKGEGQPKRADRGNALGGEQQE